MTRQCYSCPFLGCPVFDVRNPAQISRRKRSHVFDIDRSNRKETTNGTESDMLCEWCKEQPGVERCQGCDDSAPFLCKSCLDRHLANSAYCRNKIALLNGLAGVPGSSGLIARIRNRWN